MNKIKFTQALKNNSIFEMQRIPKSELHSHAGRGGSITYIEKKVNKKISSPEKPFSSLSEMNQWLNEHIKCHCPSGIDGYLLRIEAAFAQATADHVQVLALSYGMDEIELLGGMDGFMKKMDAMRQEFAPRTEFFPDLAVGYSSDEVEKLDEIFSYRWFNAIDIVNYSGTYSLKELKKICQKAKENGMVLKAHIGEFGSPDDVMRYAEELELNEIQHGIAAAKSPQIMRWLAKHKVKLNTCPTSNVMLKNCDNYATHPIRQLYDYGVPVTINTDDLLIFHSTLSEEYLHLYNSGLMNEDELYEICQTGLCHNYKKA
jgi:Adenosine deaminase